MQLRYVTFVICEGSSPVHSSPRGSDEKADLGALNQYDRGKVAGRRIFIVVRERSSSHTRPLDLSHPQLYPPIMNANPTAKADDARWPQVQPVQAEADLPRDARAVPALVAWCVSLFLHYFAWAVLIPAYRATYESLSVQLWGPTQVILRVAEGGHYLSLGVLGVSILAGGAGTLWAWRSGSPYLPAFRLPLLSTTMFAGAAALLFALLPSFSEEPLLSQIDRTLTLLPGFAATTAIAVGSIGASGAMSKSRWAVTALIGLSAATFTLSALVVLALHVPIVNLARAMR